MKRRHFPCEVPAPVPKALGVTPPWKFVRHPILGVTPPAHGAATEGLAATFGGKTRRRAPDTFPRAH